MSNKITVKGLLRGARKICNSGKFFRLRQQYSRKAFYDKRPVLKRFAKADFSLQGACSARSFFIYWFVLGLLWRKGA